MYNKIGSMHIECGKEKFEGKILTGLSFGYTLKY